MFFYKLSAIGCPLIVYLIIRGLRTLDVRLKQHYENTKTVINFLKKQKKIKEILYPTNHHQKIINFEKKYLVEQGYCQ